MPSCRSRALLFSVSAVALAGLAGAARAETTESRLQGIEAQLLQLKAELRQLKARAAARERALKAAQAASPPPAAALAPVMPHIPAGYALVQAQAGSTPGAVVLARVETPKPPPPRMGVFDVGNISIQLGGFLAAEAVYRSRNEVSDLQSNFTTGIPERNSPLHYEPEFHISSRYSRITALLTADPDEATRLQGYVSMDFMGAAPTANYNQSNSWTPRLREAWLAYERPDLGFEVLAGQAWSLLTPVRVGLEPLNVNVPETVDSAYVAGFFDARQPEFRVEKSFADRHFWLAAAIDNPQTTYYFQTSTLAAPSSLGTININNAGVSVDANGNNYSNNFAPDVIVKGAADLSFAHLELFGLGRLFNDRASFVGSGQTHTVFGGGAGTSGIIRIIPNYLEVDFDGMAGQGIGRYGAAQLPDATIGSNGQPEPLPEWMSTIGLIGHPVQPMDIYAYVGADETSARYFDSYKTSKGKTTVTPYGYGNPLYSNAGCNTQLSPLPCTANTSGTEMIAAGTWYRFLKGPYGTVQAGVQYDYVRRQVFRGLGATPKTDDNIVLVSFRYFPFQ